MHTSPELRVRKQAHALGLRFRLHAKGLPGKPDLVFPRHRIIILVHGCFWHRHPYCSKASTPKSDVQKWTEKFARNVERDERNIEDLTRLGWKVEIVWECETKSPAILIEKLKEIFRLNA